LCAEESKVNLQELKLRKNVRGQVWSVSVPMPRSKDQLRRQDYFHSGWISEMEKKTRNLESGL